MRKQAPEFGSKIRSLVQECSRTRVNKHRSSGGGGGGSGGSDDKTAGSTADEIQIAAGLPRFAEDSMIDADNSFCTVFSRTGSTMAQSPTPLIARWQQIQDDDAAQLPPSPAFSAAESAVVGLSVIGSESSFCTAASHRRRLMSQQLDELERALQLL